MAHLISEEYSSVRKHITVFGSISGNYAFRQKKTIWFESTLERDFLLKQEFNPHVIDVVSQPIEIPYVTEQGNASTYTPDFLVQLSSAVIENENYSDAPLLVEIKPIKRLKADWHKLKYKFKAAHSFAAYKGWKFKIYDERHIYDQYWKNIIFLKKYRRSFLSQDEEFLFTSILQERHVIKIKDIKHHLNKINHSNEYFFNKILILLSKNVLSCDFNSPINIETKIWLNQNYCENNSNV